MQHNLISLHFKCKNWTSKNTIINLLSLHSFSACLLQQIIAPVHLKSIKLHLKARKLKKQQRKSKKYKKNLCLDGVDARDAWNAAMLDMWCIIYDRKELQRSVKENSSNKMWCIDMPLEQILTNSAIVCYTSPLIHK